MIDSAAESPESLRRIAAMLTYAASQMEMAPLAAATGTVVAPAAPIAPVAPLPPVEVMKADAGHASEHRDPAQVFGGAAPAVPLVPAAPSVGTAAAPPAAAPTTEVVSTAVELDGAGLPWDQRIHSTPAKKNANGLWRMRRAVDPNLIQTVEAELRAIYPAKVVAPVQTTVPLPPGPAAVVVPAPPVAGGVVPPVSAPLAPVTLPGNTTPGGAPNPPAVAGVPTGTNAFQVMMDKFSKEMGPNGKLNKAAMGPFFAQLGIGGWGDLYKRADLIPTVVAEAERLTAVAA
jgi:hypothetical protein